MNPLGTVISLPFENNTLFNLGPSNSTANVLNIKPIFPVGVGNWNLINRLIVPVFYAQGQDEIVDDDFSWGNGNPGSLGIGSAFGLGDTTYQVFITPKKSGMVAWVVQLSSLPTQRIDLARTSGLPVLLWLYLPLPATGCWVGSCRISGLLLVTIMQQMSTSSRRS